MSVESAREFLVRALEDQDLLDRLAEAPKGQRQQIAREAGYDFNEDELRDARQEMLGGEEAAEAAPRVPVLLYGVVDTW